MDPRRVFSTRTLAILLLAAGCGGDGDADAPLGESNAGGNLVWMAVAEMMVAPVYPEAILVEADGAPSTGSAMMAEDVDRWRFLFPEDPDVAGSGTVWVEYEGGRFTGPFYTEQGLFGTVFEVLPRTMDLEGAVLRLREAGYPEAFSTVTFREPLTFPPPEEALYAFELPGRYVLVGAVTGQVTQEVPQVSRE